MNNTKPDDYVYTAIDSIDEVSDESIHKDISKPPSGKTKWNKLNGWQRVWLAICIFTLLPTLIFGAFSIDIIGIAPLVVYTIIWALLMALLYIGGLALRWIIKGFKDEK
jgi:hypothetical protein